MKVCVTVEVKIDQKLKRTPKTTKMQITKEEKKNMIHSTKAFKILYDKALV